MFRFWMHKTWLKRSDCVNFCFQRKICVEVDSPNTTTPIRTSCIHILGSQRCPFSTNPTSLRSVQSSICRWLPMSTWNAWIRLVDVICSLKLTYSSAHDTCLSFTWLLTVTIQIRLTRIKYLPIYCCLCNMEIFGLLSCKRRGNTQNRAHEPTVEKEQARGRRLTLQIAALFSRDFLVGSCTVTLMRRCVLFVCSPAAFMSSIDYSRNFGCSFLRLAFWICCWGDSFW